MLAFHVLHYNIVMNPVYAVEILNDLWAKEPAGMLSICITTVGLLLTLTFKLLDFWWDLYKERSRQGKLRIELEADVDLQGHLVLWTTISNTGQEPIVLRDLGYVRSHWLGKEFISVTPIESPLPRALNARDLVRIPITDEVADLMALAENFRIKDSMGKLWEVVEGDIRRVRRQLKVLKTTRGRQAHVTANRHSLLEALETSPPISTQN